jgi:integrase/recombinase XerC
MANNMQEIFNKYIKNLEAEQSVSPYTIRNYTTDLCGSKEVKGFLAFLKEKGIDAPDKVDRTVLRDYMAYLVEEGIVKASIARKLSAIRSFYRYMVREKILEANPIEKTSSPKLDKRLPSFLTIDEVVRLLNAPDLSKPHGQRDRALLELLYASGLRVSELVHLDIGEINLGTGEIRVWGKGSKERMVLMGKPAAEAVSNYLAQGRPKLVGEKKTNALFINRYGQRLPERRVQKLLEEYAKQAGIEKRVHPHILRHTFATHLLDGGADLRVVQELLGHAQLSSTQIYTHVTKSQARKVYLSAHPMAKEDKEDESQNKQ